MGTSPVTPDTPDHASRGRGGRIETPAPLGKHNPRLTRLRRLVRREVPALTVVDGEKIVLDLAAAGVILHELYTTVSAAAVLRQSPVRDALPGPDSWHLLTPESLDSIAPTRQSQGILAVVSAPAWQLQPAGIVVHLDGIQDPGNLGALIRSAAALGAAGVTCSPDSADPFSPRAIRGAAGCSLRFPVVPNVDIEPLAESFRRAGGSVAAALGKGGQPLREWRPRRPLLLVLGNEGAGVRPPALSACSESITIPLLRGVESLNVAVAAGVVLAFLGGLAAPPILER